MMYHLILVIFSFCVYFILLFKSIETRSYGNDTWKLYQFRLWQLICLSIMGLIPVINVLFTFIIGFTIHEFTDDLYFRIRENSCLGKIIKFLNKKV